MAQLRIDHHSSEGVEVAHQMQRMVVLPRMLSALSVEGVVEEVVGLIPGLEAAPCFAVWT